jgi:hypothetical protein
MGDDLLGVTDSRYGRRLVDGRHLVASKLDRHAGFPVLAHSAQKEHRAGPGGRSASATSAASTPAAS